MTGQAAADGGERSPHAYRPGVGIMLLNARRQVLVGQRLDTPSTAGSSAAWQMPQGGIDGDETPEAAAMRELKEEIGTNHAEIIAEGRDWLTYDLPDDLAATLWGGRYRGQRQKWFAMRFLGRDADVNVETARPEFGDWKWLEPHALPDVIVPFKRALYRQLLAEFAHLIEETGA